VRLRQEISQRGAQRTRQNGGDSESENRVGTERIRARDRGYQCGEDHDADIEAQSESLVARSPAAVPRAKVKRIAIQ
jgi:hypothetical protein